MEPATAVALITALAQAAKALAPLIAEGTMVFTSSQEAEIKDGLEHIQTLNDATTSRVLGKLAD